MKLSEWLIIQKNLILMVWQELNNFRYLGIIVPLVDWFLERRNIIVSIWFYIWCGIGSLIVMWGIGFIMDRLHMFHYQNNFHNRRNPLLMKQLRELRAIHRLLSLEERKTKK